MTFKLCNLSAYNHAQKKNEVLNKKWAKLEQLNLEPIELQHQKYLAWKQQEDLRPEFADYCCCPEDIATWLYQNVKGFYFTKEGLYGKKKQELANQLAAIATNHNFNNSQFRSIIGEISAFLDKHPIIFADN